MFNKRPQPAIAALDKAIMEALTQLDLVPAYSEEAFKIMNHIERLEKLKESNTPPRLSPDTLAIVIGNFLGIAMIVEYERAHVVASKAMQLLTKAVR